jgi:putative peptidoglycan lipid II flippase
VVLSTQLGPEHRALALGAGHSLGVTAAGLALLVVVARVAGARALAGVLPGGLPAVAAAALGAAAGLLVARLLGADPVPVGGVLAAVGSGVLAACAVLVVAGAVIMGTARAPLAAAVGSLRTSGRQEVHGG